MDDLIAQHEALIQAANKRHRQRLEQASDQSRRGVQRSLHGNGAIFTGAASGRPLPCNTRGNGAVPAPAHATRPPLSNLANMERPIPESHGRGKKRSESSRLEIGVQSH
jgi:hypothetical protein